MFTLSSAAAFYQIFYRLKKEKTTLMTTLTIMIIIIITITLLIIICFFDSIFYPLEVYRGTLMFRSDLPHGRTKQITRRTPDRKCSSRTPQRNLASKLKMKFRGKIIDVACLNHFTRESVQLPHTPTN